MKLLPLTAFLNDIANIDKANVVTTAFPEFTATIPTTKFFSLINGKNKDGNRHKKLDIRFLGCISSEEDDGANARFSATNLELSIPFDDYSIHPQDGLTLRYGGFLMMAIKPETEQPQNVFANAFISYLIGENLLVRVALRKQTFFDAQLSEDILGIFFYPTGTHLARLSFINCGPVDTSDTVRIEAETFPIAISFDHLEFEKDGLVFSYDGQEILSIRVFEENPEGTGNEDLENSKRKEKLG